jgi:hypothetical protein
VDAPIDLRLRNRDRHLLDERSEQFPEVVFSERVSGPHPPAAMPFASLAAFDRSGLWSWM